MELAYIVQCDFKSGFVTYECPCGEEIEIEMHPSGVEMVACPKCGKQLEVNPTKWFSDEGE